MIKESLQFIQNCLDRYLRNRFALDDTHVVLNNLIEGDGSVPLLNQNKVVISLINIEKEINRAFHVQNRKMPDGSFLNTNPSERFNLILLISSNFDDYGETLKFLNETILFFQANIVLDRGVSSAIPPGLSKLEMEVEKINYHQMQGLWTSMGAKYRPSILYKVRLIVLDAAEVAAFVPAVNDYNTNLSAS